MSKVLWAVIVVFAVVALAGCKSEINDESTKKRGEARKELFVECMELAAKMPRQADDDVSDIVDECTSSSYYMTNYIN